MDGWTTDDGRTPEYGYIICSPCEPEGSGKLIISTCFPTQSSAMSLCTDILPSAMFCNVDTSSRGYRRQNQSGINLVQEFIMLEGSIQTENGPSFQSFPP